MLDKRLSLKLIKENSNSFGIHSFGISDAFDRYFVERSGENGSFSFIENISEISSNIILALNKSLRSYLYDIKINAKNIEIEHSYSQPQKACYQYDFLNYYFITKNKIENNIDIDLQYYYKNELVKKNILLIKQT